MRVRAGARVSLECHSDKFAIAEISYTFVS